MQTYALAGFADELEKLAAKKKKDRGMSTAAKVGLTAATLAGGLGLGRVGLRRLKASQEAAAKAKKKAHKAAKKQRKKNAGRFGEQIAQQAMARDPFFRRVLYVNSPQAQYVRQRRRALGLS